MGKVKSTFYPEGTPDAVSNAKTTRAASGKPPSALQLKIREKLKSYKLKGALVE